MNSKKNGNDGADVPQAGFYGAFGATPEKIIKLGGLNK